MKNLMSSQDLSNRALELFPDNSYLQRAWYNAVLWLRNCSQVGFAIDKETLKDPKRHVLHGYIAPAEPMTVAHVLPDDQVIPGVVNIKRRSK